MNIKAIFPSGASELIVHGLHQWDYGRKLEIHADDLPALIEVHFACAGMTEAVVRSCAVVQGVAEATIPDQCLEQTTPIVAWVYEVGASSGATTKTITLTVIQRARPQPGGTIPPSISDKYTEMVGAVNEQLNALKAGNVTVSRALTADSAGYASAAGMAQRANTADTADTASYTDHAGFAESASLADYADKAGSAEKADTAKQMTIVRNLTPNSKITMPGLYLVVYRNTSQTNVEECELLNITYLSNTAYGAMGAVPTESNGWVHKGPAYNPDRTNMTNTITLVNMPGYEITTIWLLAAYDIDQ